MPVKNVNKKTLLFGAKSRVYSPLQVAAAVVSCFMVLVLFDAKGISRWAGKLQASRFSTLVKNLADRHWEAMAALGLEEPKIGWERSFLTFQKASPLLYPKSYGELKARRLAKAKAFARDQAGIKARLESNKTTDSAIMAIKALASKEAAMRRGRKGPQVLLMGDSIMMSVGPAIKKDVVDRLKGEAVLKAKVSTGLARPDVFDWREELLGTLTQDRFDYVVILMGTNDSQDFIDGDQLYTYGSKGWVKIYNKRIEDLLSLACLGAKHVIWLGLPPMQSEAFNLKAARINGWAKQQARKQSCAKYVPMDSIVGDQSGHFVSYLEIRKKLEKVRTVDGIHLTAFGGNLVSKVLLGDFKAWRSSLAH